jgi:competence protein ComEC
MKNKYQKYFGLAFLICISLFSIVYSSGVDFKVSVLSTNDSNASELSVSFLNVGQGDAIYIRTPDDVDVLIDGGPDKSILNELGSVMPFWDKEIDLMILTHPHSDHVAGLVEVLRRYQVKKILYTGVLHTAPDYLAWLEEIKEQGIPLEIVDKKSRVLLGSFVQLDLLYPNKSYLNQKVKNLNNTSIVARLIYGEISFLFTGDAEVEVEEELLADGSIVLDSDVLKVGHHGSRSSSSWLFLQAVSPELAIIQVGKDNSFEHPHGETLFNLQKLKVTLLRTDLNSTSTLISNGTGIQLLNN